MTGKGLLEYPSCVRPVRKDSWAPQFTIEEERSLKLLIRGWKRSLVCNEWAGEASVGFVRRLRGSG